MGAMPKTGKNDHARKDELPSTLQRSDQKAQDTFAKTYDSALQSYDNDEERAARLTNARSRASGHPSPPPAASTPMRPRSTSTSWPGNWTSRAAQRWTRT